MARDTRIAPAGGEAGAFDVVHARVLRQFPELVADLGGDPAQLLLRAGMTSRDIDSATYRQVLQLLDLAAGELKRPDFGLRLAARQGAAGAFGPLGEVMRNSATFGEALGYVSTHAFAHSLATRIWLRPIEGERAVFAGHDILQGRMPGGNQAIEQILLLGHLAAREITGGKARVRWVHFRHQPLSPPAVYRRHFGCGISFGQDADGAVFSENDLAAPIVDPDRQAHDRMTAFIDAHFTRQRPPLHAELRGVIMRLLGSGDCSNARAAAELGLHPRTLHRRLREEGVSFQSVKDEVRRDMMLYLIGETAMDFARISERLGFAEQSVLTRLCNRWFGASPTALRERGG